MQYMEHNIFPSVKTAFAEYFDIVESVLHQHELVVQNKSYRWRQELNNGISNVYFLQFDQLKKVLGFKVLLTNRLTLEIKEKYQQEQAFLQLRWALNTVSDKTACLNIVKETNSAIEQAIKDTSCAKV